MEQQQLSKQEVLDKLGISDFSQLSKEKLMTFASLVGKMEPEVEEKAISQVPQFAETALGALQDFRQTLDGMVVSNSASIMRCYDICDKIISTLQEWSHSRQNLSLEEQRFIIEQMKDVADMASYIDAENKKHTLRLVGVVGSFLIVVVVFGLMLITHQPSFIF